MLDANWDCVILAVLVHTTLHQFEPKSATSGAAIIGLAPLLLFRDAINHTLTCMSFVQTYVSFLVALALSVVLYRVSPMHPLYNIPGPITNKITKGVGMYYSYSGRHHLILKALHEKYGPIVRTGMPR